MIAKIIALLAALVVGTISRLGYTGIVFLMALESACIPLPSEITMPFAGYLASIGTMNLWGVALAGTIGCQIGSLAAYYLGALGGRPLVERYGRYVLFSNHDLEIADRWFRRHGDITVFLARLLPVIRTFIALPAGISRMEIWRFNLYTFVGSFIWSLGLAWIGMKLGTHWDTLGPYFHRSETLIGATLILAALWYLYRHLKNLRHC
ncbi:MAG: DedA family protein [Gammaproteobacteria bacterium]|nr:DedA family protein [Gammaproteobacteria bacterium]